MGEDRVHSRHADQRRAAGRRRPGAAPGRRDGHRHRPVEIPPGKLPYVRGAGSATTSTVDTAGGWRHTTVSYLPEMWLDPQGAIPLMIRRSDGGRLTVNLPDPDNARENLETEIGARRYELLMGGLSLRKPTAEFLPGLPTDPTELLTRLTAAAREDGGGP